MSLYYLRITVFFDLLSFMSLSDLLKKKTKTSSPLREKIHLRMEAIGGQGAHSAGKIIAEAAVIGMNYSGHHFSSYGSEKRGSPVKSYVRFYQDERAIRSSSPVIHPDILVIFHESLIFHHPEIVEDSHSDTLVLVHSKNPPEAVLFPENFRAKTVSTLDALSIAHQVGCQINGVMLGAFSHLCPEIDPQILRKTLVNFFHKLSESQKESLIKGFNEGWKKIKTNLYVPSQSQLESKFLTPHPTWDIAPPGGLILNPGNTPLKDLASSRKGTVPELKRDLCIHCGLCDMVCPDYCFVWNKETAISPTPLLLGIDYQYCKGCQKCIVACPMKALVAVPDTEEFTQSQQVKKFPELL